ncbi:unnamed protein product [Closterium sp. NIES-64]|nr:unnamed protein product [Closterium sp. NIES-64]
MVKKRKAKNQDGAGDMDIGDAAVTSAVTSTAGTAKDAASAGFPSASAAEGSAAASGLEAGGPIASGNEMALVFFISHAIPASLSPPTQPPRFIPPHSPFTSATLALLNHPSLPPPNPPSPLVPFPPIIPPLPRTLSLSPSPPEPLPVPLSRHARPLSHKQDTSETMGFTVIKASADAARSIPALPAMRKKGAPERRAKTRRKQKLLDKALAIREKTETKAQKHAAKKARVQTLKKLY